MDNNPPDLFKGKLSKIINFRSKYIYFDSFQYMGLSVRQVMIFGNLFLLHDPRP